MLVDFDPSHIERNRHVVGMKNQAVGRPPVSPVPVSLPLIVTNARPAPISPLLLALCPRLLARGGEVAD